MITIKEDFKEFMEAHSNDDATYLRLKCAGSSASFDIPFAIDQIECRRKTAKKLSRFLANPDFLFPTVLSAEQASHQDVGRLHASLCTPGARVLDMTAGLGIDAMSMAQAGADVTAIDISEPHAQILAHNAAILYLNMTVVCADSCDYIEKHPDLFFDIIFIDPARRDGDSRRTYAFADSTPDISRLAPMLLHRCHRLVIKASPMLDISQALKEIPGVKEVWCVCVKGECKEVTLIASLEETDPIIFKAIDINDSGEPPVFSFDGSTPEADINYHKGAVNAGKWLLEPNAAIMKLGCWRQLTNRFPGIEKLDPNTHLFIADAYIPKFPGRRLRVVGSGSPKQYMRFRGNVAVRNYPLTASQLATKIKATSGDDARFLYGVRAGGKPILIEATRD